MALFLAIVPIPVGATLLYATDRPTSTVWSVSGMKMKCRREREREENCSRPSRRHQQKTPPIEEGNETYSFQLFVEVLDTCLAWEMLMLPSNAHAATNMPYLRAPDGNTSDQTCEYVSLDGVEVCYGARRTCTMHPSPQIFVRLKNDLPTG